MTAHLFVMVIKRLVLTLGLVDRLGNANYVAVHVSDWYTQHTARLKAHLAVHLTAEARILEQAMINIFTTVVDTAIYQISPLGLYMSWTV